MAAGDALRYLVLSVVGLVVLVAGMKFWGKQKAEKKIVYELRILANPTSSFEQIYPADAEKALLRSMAEMNRAEVRLKMEPGAILEQVFHGKGEGALFPIEGLGRDYSPDARETLIKEGLLRNYQHCRTLGFFEDPAARKLLESGERPQIAKGPAKGATVHIRFLIDPKVSPGVEKLIPNMVLGPPPGPHETGVPNDLQIKQAKTLTSLLHRASLLEDTARDRIVAHYDRIAAGQPEEEEPPGEEPEAKPAGEDPPPDEEPDQDEPAEEEKEEDDQTDPDPFPC